MTAKECILGRRSIRKYKADAVDHETLKQVIETASYAPSWKHTQIVRYIAVEGELYYNLTIDEVKMKLLEELKPKKMIFDEEVTNAEEVQDEENN